MLRLASRSPRRRQLLSWITEDFETVPSGFDEGLVSDPVPERLVRKLAEGKARAVWEQHREAVVIGCDTVVVSPDNQVFGIPEDAAQAADMLKALSGRTHRVITGVCVLDGEKKSIFHKTVKVHFVPLSQEDIAWYLSTGEPFDKAGAYGIQGYGGVFVDRINGDYNSVVGLPVQSLRKVLQNYKY